MPVVRTHVQGRAHWAFTSKRVGLRDEIRPGRVHYGDPPNVNCCAGGASMNSVPHGILEYWSRDYEVSMDWQRDPNIRGASRGGIT
jgi:hypothetical protein